MKTSPNWSKFIRSKQDHSGLFLVQMNDGAIHLGQFYCGAFVRDGFFYNNTPGMLSQIKFIQAVKPLIALIVLIAFPILASPPALPHYTPKPRPLKHTAGSKVGAVALMKAMSVVAPKPRLGTRWTWQYPGCAQFATFQFYGRPTLDAVPKLLGTRTNAVWDLWQTNGAMQFLECVAVDEALPRNSKGLLK